MDTHIATVRTLYRGSAITVTATHPHEIRNTAATIPTNRVQTSLFQIFRTLRCAHTSTTTVQRGECIGFLSNGPSSSSHVLALCKLRLAPCLCRVPWVCFGSNKSCNNSSSQNLRYETVLHPFDATKTAKVSAEKQQVGVPSTHSFKNGDTRANHPVI